MQGESKHANNSLQCSLSVSTDQLSLEQTISDISKVTFLILPLFICCIGSSSCLLFGGGVLGNLNREGSQEFSAYNVSHTYKRKLTSADTTH